MIRRAAGWRSSSGKVCLPRLRLMKCRVSPGASGASWRTGSPSSGSILITWAPPCARSCAQNGAAMNCPNSTTSTPAKARSPLPSVVTGTGPPGAASAAARVSPTAGGRARRGIVEGGSARGGIPRRPANPTPVTDGDHPGSGYFRCPLDSAAATPRPMYRLPEIHRSPARSRGWPRSQPAAVPAVNA